MEFSQFSAFLITFREALEALLIVGIISTYIVRVGAVRWLKWVWVGAGLAVAASLVVAYVFQVILSGFSGLLSQTYLRFFVMFLSAALLTHMAVWVAKQTKDLKWIVHSKIEKILSAGSIANMVVHSFLVVLREGVETVFFFAAISGGQIGTAITSWGALAGLVTAMSVAYLFFKGSTRISLSLFFKITGMLIILIAAGLISNGIGMMQDMGKMGSVYTTKGGQIGEVYNIVSIMPEHPTDEEHYIRNTEKKPLISGNAGVFFNAMFGYTHNPSVEQFVAYWLYYLVTFFILLWIGRTKKYTSPCDPEEKAAENNSPQSNVKEQWAGQFK